MNPRKKNQRITTDSALSPFVTYSLPTHSPDCPGCRAVWLDFVALCFKIRRLGGLSVTVRHRLDWRPRLCACAAAGSRRFCFGIIAATLYSGAATAEVYFSDSNVEVSGDGPRNSRNCTILLKPAQTFGAELAPRIMMVTLGQARMSIGVERPAQYQNPVIVQDNVRRTLAGSGNFSSEQFRQSETGKAIRSQRLFFVTARHGDTGRYLSSRYERIDFDTLLAKIEANCPFDAESWMADVSARERTEGALSLSPAELKQIRWAMDRKYGNLLSEPEPSNSLSSLERSYLKRYTADNGLPISQYLTQDTARRLSAEGAALAKRSPPPPKPAGWNSIAVGIWQMNGRSFVAIGYSGALPSKEEGEARALALCQGAPGRNCKTQGAWNLGCVYITSGSKATGVRWGAAATADAALSICRAGGYDCRPPIGGCVN
jgi:hypothetical protein